MNQIRNRNHSLTPKNRFLQVQYHAHAILNVSQPSALKVCITALLSERNLPAGVYLLKVNIRNTRTRCEISQTQTGTGVVLIFLLFLFSYSRCSYFSPCSSVSIVNFEHLIAGWASEWLGISPDILALLTESLQKHFDTFKFKI